MPKRKGKTTIAISEEVKKELDDQRDKGESYDDIIKRLLSGECDIYVEILSVDGELPISHQVIFRLGNFYYHYKEGNFHPLNVKAATVAKKAEEVFPK